MHQPGLPGPITLLAGIAAIAIAALALLEVCCQWPAGG